MNDIAVLSYHSVLRDPRLAEGPDAHYAISERDFSNHMDALDRAGFAIRSVCALLEPARRTAKAVAVTLDEARQDSFDIAFGLFTDRGITGDFFVRPTTVETGAHVSWARLREMSDAGMSIQSHGLTERYLDDLSSGEVMEELDGSKKEIEDRIGRPVYLFAPPHGGCNTEVAMLAKQAGYRAICGSRPGRWRPVLGAYEIPRLAVQGSTSIERMLGWADGRGLAQMALRYRLLGAAKATFGNKNYEKLRDRLLRSRGGS